MFIARREFRSSALLLEVPSGDAVFDSNVALGGGFSSRVVFPKHRTPKSVPI